MTPTTLLFLPVDHCLVQNFEKLEAGRKCFVGRKYVQVTPPSDPKDPEDFGRWGFEPTGEPDRVAYRAEYVRACRDGELEPADAATAAACGVPWRAPVQLDLVTTSDADEPAAAA